MGGGKTDIQNFSVFNENQLCGKYSRVKKYFVSHSAKWKHPLGGASSSHLPAQGASDVLEGEEREKRGTTLASLVELHMPFSVASSF